MITSAAILTATQLLTLVSVFILWTLFLAVLSHVSLSTLAGPSVRVADRIVLAQAVQRTVLTPLIRLTCLIAEITRPSLVAGALIRTRADPVHTVLITVRLAGILCLKVTGTAMFLQLVGGFVLHLGDIPGLQLVGRALPQFPTKFGSTDLKGLLDGHRDLVGVSGEKNISK